MRLTGMLYDLDDDDEPREDRELPHDAVGVCGDCEMPAGDLVEGLCSVCRCAGCGVPDAPVEHNGHRLCRVCARENGWIEPLRREWEAAE